MNNTNLPEILQRLGIIAAAIVITIYAVIQQSTVMIIGVLAFTPIILFINRPEMFVIAIIGVSNSALLVPGLPRGLQLMHLLMLAFIPVMVARYAILKPRQDAMPLSFRAVLLLMAWLVLLIQERGLGLRSGGEGLVGGASYIKFFLCGGFLIFSRYIVLTPRQWTVTITMMVAGSFIPIAAEQLFIQSGGMVTIQYLFIEPYVSGLVETLMAKESDSGAVARLTAFTGAASSLLMASLVLTTRRTGFRFSTYLLVGLCLLFAGLSGFRSLLFETIALTAMYRLFIAPPGQRAPVFFAILGAGVAGLLVLIPMTSYLPLAMQRALSWLPFAEIDIMARMGADQSTEWRFRLWEFAWEQSGPFLWIGRGFAVSAAEVMSANIWKDDLLQFWYSHQYHSGPLSAWIDLGLPGFLLLMVFFIAAAYEVLFRNITPSNDIIYRFQTFIRVKILFSIAAYMLIFGDVRSTVAGILVNLAIFYSLDATNRVAAKAADAPAKPPAPAKSFRPLTDKPAV